MGTALRKGISPFSVVDAATARRAQVHPTLEPMKTLNTFKLLCAAAAAASLVAISACSDSNASTPTYDSALDAAAKAAVPSVVKTLEELVNIETGTGDAIGMPLMTSYLEQRLQALGAVVTRHKAEADVVGENLTAVLTGTGTRKLLLMAHMDTVYPRGTLEKYPFRVEGNRAFGPGIVDDKGGIANILHALQLLRDRGMKDYGSITVLFNTDEERGSFGSRDLIQKVAAVNDFILSFEGGGDSFGLASSGIGYVEARIKGLQSHAGLAPEAGVNSLTEAADFILRTQDIDDKASGRRFNWTVARAGNSPTVTNVIPDLTVLNADMRVARNEDYDLVKTMLEERAAKKRLDKSVIEVSVTRGRPAFNAGEEGLKLAQRGVEILKELGVPSSISTARAGAGADVSYAGLSGKPTLDGFGLVGDGYHSNGVEWVTIDLIPSRLYLATRMLIELSQGR